jgi:hypothetical protein
MTGKVPVSPRDVERWPDEVLRALVPLIEANASFDLSGGLLRVHGRSGQREKQLSPLQVRALDAMDGHRSLEEIAVLETAPSRDTRTDIAPDALDEGDAWGEIRELFLFLAQQHQCRPRNLDHLVSLLQ